MRCSEIALEYGKKVRQVAGEILRGVSASLGLEENYIEKAINLENGLQLLGANLYPRCPQPNLAMGLPPHSDIGVLTLQTQYGVEGLQVQHQGKWINVNPVPNSFIGLLGDHIEVLHFPFPHFFCLVTCFQNPVSFQYFVLIPIVL